MFGAGETQAATQTVASGVSIQSSCYGGVVPVIYGRARLTGNLLWYGGFQAIAVQSSAGDGGKGGGGNSGSTSYDYKASFIFALGEGALTDVQNVWASKTKTTLSDSHLSFASGALTQSPWGYLSTKFPAQALAYAGTGYVYAMAYDLGSSAQMPNLSYEVTGLFSDAIPGLPDADPAMVVYDILTNPRYGVGFPLARIPLAGLAVFSSYCRAAGLVISPVFDTQQDAASRLNQIVQDCNAEFVWSGTSLSVVPYGDRNLSANGATYSAPAAPLYSLTDDDFLDQGGQDPVQCARTRPSDQMNSIRLEWLNRANDYNVEIADAKNQAAIEAYGLRGDQPAQAHAFCDLNAVTMAATLKLQRQSVRNVYSFTLGWRYCLLDPMDIVEISDAALGLNQQWVRILSLEEDDNGNIRVIAEEYLGGTGHAPLYAFETGNPYIANYNAPPGAMNTPLIFEPPPVMLAARSVIAPQIMIGASGSANWGGCEVWVSLDDATYKRMGRITAPARQGALHTTLASGPDPDTTHTLTVDMSESGGVLLSGTQADADAFRTLCYVDGELIAYETASFTGGSLYGLTYLRRGVYGSTVTAHAAGTAFCRLDESVASFDLPVTPVSYVGQTLYLKFLSYNVYGGALQQLSDVTAVTYNPNGSGVFVFPPSGVSFTVGAEEQKDGSWISFGVIAWTASPDPLFDQYEVQYRLHTGPGPWISWRCGPDTTSFRVSPLPANTAYDVQVRAVRTSGPFYSAWAQCLNVATAGKTAPPPAPTGLTVAGGYRQITIDWAASAENDIAWYEVWESGDGTLSHAGRIGLVTGTHYVRPGLNLDDTRYYWVRAQDTSGNFSTYLGPGHATTLGVDAGDVTGQIVTAQIADGAVTGDQIADETIDITKIDTPGGYGLPVYVTALPASGSNLRYTGSLVILATDGKLYRYVGGAWTRAVDGGDLLAQSVTTDAIVAGAITTALLAAGAVTASKLYVGDTTNLISDPLFQDQDYWSTQDGLGTVCAYNSGATVHNQLNVPTAAAFICGGIPAGSSAQFLFSTPPVAVQQATSYRFRMDAFSTNTANKNLSVAFQFYSAAGAAISTATTPALEPGAPGPYNPSAATYEYVFSTPAATATVTVSLQLVANQPSSVAGVGNWFIGSPRLERQSTGTLIENGVITTEHIVAAGIDGGAITAGTITGDRLTGNFFQGSQFTASSGGSGRVLINGEQTTVGGLTDGPYVATFDSTGQLRCLIGHWAGGDGLWIWDGSGNVIFAESSLGSSVVTTGTIAANNVTYPYGVTVSAGTATNDTSWTTLWSHNADVTGTAQVSALINFQADPNTADNSYSDAHVQILVNGTVQGDTGAIVGRGNPITAGTACSVAVSAGQTILVQAKGNLSLGGNVITSGAINVLIVQR